MTINLPGFNPFEPPVNTDVRVWRSYRRPRQVIDIETKDDSQIDDWITHYSDMDSKERKFWTYSQLSQSVSTLTGYEWVIKFGLKFRTGPHFGINTSAGMGPLPSIGLSMSVLSDDTGGGYSAIFAFDFFVPSGYTRLTWGVNGSVSIKEISENVLMKGKVRSGARAIIARLSPQLIIFDDSNYWSKSSANFPKDWKTNGITYPVTPGEMMRIGYACMLNGEYGNDIGYDGSVMSTILLNLAE